MQIQFFRGENLNFGDELNTWLWPQLAPTLFDNDASVLFIGIGSTIGTHYDPKAKKVVFGTGFVPTYHDAPDVHGGDWDIFFVRGPRTARALAIPEELAVGDSAILIRALPPLKPHTPTTIGFMPHWQSLPRGEWQKVCELAGLTLIDPTQSVEQVLKSLLDCKLLITEAMHGAIVADALRVPWIPMLPVDSFHRDKWFDWAEALKIDLRPYRLWPSNTRELVLATERRPHLNNAAKRLSHSPINRLVDSCLAHTAASRLLKVSRHSPCLSGDSAIEFATNRMLEHLDALKHKYSKS